MLKDKSYIYTFIALFMVIFIDTIGVGLVWPLFAPLFMGQTGSVFSVNVPFFERDLLYGITMGVFPVFMFFGAPILGDLSDHIGRKKVLLLCLLGTSVGLGICALGVIWCNVYLLIFGRALLGVLAGSQATAQAAIIDISNPEKKALTLSTITLASNFGFIFGPMLGGILIDQRIVSWFNYTTPFVISAILALCNAVFLCFVFKETFDPKKIVKMHLTKGVRVFVSAFTNAKMRMLAIIYLSFQIGWAIAFQFSVMSFVQSYGYSGLQVGRFLSLISLVYVISLLGIIRIALIYFRLEKIICWALGISVISFIVAIWNKEIIIWAAMLFATFGVALSYAGLLTLISNSVSTDEQGWAMGIVGALNAVAWGFGALFAGSMGIFKISLPFVATSLFTGISLILMIFLINNKKIAIEKSE